MDKLYHLAAGFIISLTVGVLFYNLGIDSPIRAEGYGWLAAIFAGAIKEFADVAISKDWKRWDMFDFLATGMGGLIATGAIVIYRM